MRRPNLNDEPRGRIALTVACKRPASHTPPSVSQGMTRCTLALLEAMAPIRELGLSVASLEFACERHQLFAVVLATSHIVEFAALD